MYQAIQSGCKAFDNLAKKDCVTTGNVWGNCQLSGFVRGFLNCECNGYNNYSAGDLQAFDLKLFNHVPKHVMKSLKEHSAGMSSVIFYEFRTFKGSKDKFVHSYLICSEDNKLIKAFVNRRGRKSHDVAKAVLPKVTINSDGEFVANYF